MKRKIQSIIHVIVCGLLMTMVPQSVCAENSPIESAEIKKNKGLNWLARLTKRAKFEQERFNLGFCAFMKSLRGYKLTAPEKQARSVFIHQTEFLSICSLLLTTGSLFTVYGLKKKKISENNNSKNRSTLNNPSLNNPLSQSSPATNSQPTGAGTPPVDTPQNPEVLPSESSPELPDLFSNDPYDGPSSEKDAGEGKSNSSVSKGKEENNEPTKREYPSTDQSAFSELGSSSSSTPPISSSAPTITDNQVTPSNAGTTATTQEEQSANPSTGVGANNAHVDTNNSVPLTAAKDTPSQAPTATNSSNEPELDSSNSGDEEETPEQNAPPVPPFENNSPQPVSTEDKVGIISPVPSSNTQVAAKDTPPPAKPLPFPPTKTHDGSSFPASPELNQLPASNLGLSPEDSTQAPEPKHPNSLVSSSNASSSGHNSQLSLSNLRNALTELKNAVSNLPESTLNNLASSAPSNTDSASPENPKPTLSQSAPAIVTHQQQDDSGASTQVPVNASSGDIGILPPSDLKNTVSSLPGSALNNLASSGAQIPDNKSASTLSHSAPAIVATQAPVNTNDNSSSKKEDNREKNDKLSFSDYFPPD